MKRVTSPNPTNSQATAVPQVSLCGQMTIVPPGWARRCRWGRWARAAWLRSLCQSASRRACFGDVGWRRDRFPNRFQCQGLAASPAAGRPEARAPRLPAWLPENCCHAARSAGRTPAPRVRSPGHAPCQRPTPTASPGSQPSGPAARAASADTSRGAEDLPS